MTGSSLSSAGPIKNTQWTRYCDKTRMTTDQVFLNNFITREKAWNVHTALQLEHSEHVYHASKNAESQSCCGCQGFIWRIKEGVWMACEALFRQF